MKLKYYLDSLVISNRLFTVKNIDYIDNSILLDYPNKEVASSFSIHLLTELNDSQTPLTSSLLFEMIRALRSNSTETKEDFTRD